VFGENISRIQQRHVGDRRASATVPAEMLLAFNAVSSCQSAEAGSRELPANTLFVASRAKADNAISSSVTALTLVNPAPPPVNALPVLLKSARRCRCRLNWVAATSPDVGELRLRTRQSTRPWHSVVTLV